MPQKNPKSDAADAPVESRALAEFERQSLSMIE